MPYLYPTFHNLLSPILSRTFYKNPVHAMRMEMEPEDEVLILWLLSQAERVLVEERGNSYCPLTENCQRYVMCLVPPARLSWLQNAVSRRNTESSFVADGGGALLALGCANPVAGFVSGLTVALFNLFVSLVRDAEIGGVQSGYTSSAEWGTQKAYEAAQMEAMVALQRSRFH